MVITVNAGPVPSDDWTIDPEVGGGRVIGEACHFIDLLRHLANSPVTSVHALPLGQPDSDSTTISLSFRNGSFGAIHYLDNAHHRLPKERLEVSAAGRTLTLLNLRLLRDRPERLARLPKPMARQDKGHRAAATAFVGAIVNHQPSPLPPSEAFEAARASVDAAAQGLPTATS
jgi:predicted dehydrogenase